jgi:hypothetical protein
VLWNGMIVFPMSLDIVLNLLIDLTIEMRVDCIGPSVDNLWVKLFPELLGDGLPVSIPFVFLVLPKVGGVETTIFSRMKFVKVFFVP